MAVKEQKDFFNVLYGVNVNDSTEKKNGLTYLPWAYAWAEVKKRYPLSFFTVYEREDGSLVWPDPVGGHVKTGVTIVFTDDNGNERKIESIEYLPIMDFKNKAIPFDSIDSMNVNKTVQRSLTKALARHGLGLYVYAGEDLPEEDANTLSDLISEVDTTIRAKIKNMTNEQKINLANNVIKPIIGDGNYKACKDTDKLDKLLTELKNN